MNKIKALLSIPGSVWVNFRYLPLRKAIKLPIFVSYETKIDVNKGAALKLPEKVTFGMIQIGFHDVTVATRTKTIIKIYGILEFKGTAFIGRSTRFHVAKDAKLVLGDDFKISSSSSIMCYKNIEFGKNIQFSWDCLVMDSDTHLIVYEDGRESHADKPVVFGDNIWIGCRCTILKGSKIPSNCVIGANTLITGQSFEENSIIAGNPPCIIKKIKGWKL